jgi:DNA-binding response OmpR family regulator
VTDREAPCKALRASVPRSWQAGKRFTANRGHQDHPWRPPRWRSGSARTGAVPGTDLPLAQVCAASFVVPVAGLYIAKVRVLAGVTSPGTQYHSAQSWPCERLSIYRKRCTVDERLLLVEDDASIREIVSIGLKAAGFRVVTATDGREGLATVRADGFDAVMLDVMLPSLDGFEVCREIRKFSRVPVVMLTARTDLIDVVVGLESGADDYVKKPFELPELIARLRAVLRRVAAPAEAEPIVAGRLEIDPAGFAVRKDGVELALTATEFRLLLELARRPGQVFTRELLLQRVWDYDYLGESHLVDVAIGRLRAKVEDDPSHPALIKTIRGVGYRLDRA